MSRAFIADVLRHYIPDSEIARRQAAHELVEEIIKEIITKGSFTLPRFGTFRLVQTKPRVGKNPRTGETVPISAGATVRFKASPSLRNQAQKVG